MSSAIVPVIDYRRHRMTLQWHISSGSWSDFDEPVAIVHGVCFVRATGPNICLYAENGQLRLQIGSRIIPMTGRAPHISCPRILPSLGLRRQFRVDTGDGQRLYRQAYWASQRNDFFAWLAAKSREQHWQERTALRWTEGLNPAELRAEVNPPVPPP